MSEIDFGKLSFEDIIAMKKKMGIPAKTKDLNFDDSNVLANFAIDSQTSFNSHGAPETIYENLTDKQLVERFLTVDFLELSDIEIKNYFQEMHNRVAKKLGIPAIEVNVKENSKIEHIVGDDHMGSFLYAAPIEVVYDIDAQTPNMGILISKSRDNTKDFKPSHAGIDYLISIFHETRHLQQAYAANKLFQNSSQTIHDDYLNSVAFMETLLRITNMFLKDPSAAYPNIQSPDDKDSIKSLQNYYLQPYEIDARKFSIEQMELLEKKGLLKNTNWNKYKYNLYFEEYFYLNELNEYSKDICPTIAFENRLYKKAIRLIKLNDKIMYEKFAGAFNKFKFFALAENLQNYYEHLKQNLKVAMIDTQKNFFEMDKDFECLNKRAVENMTRGYLEALGKHSVFGAIYNMFYNAETSKIYVDNEMYNKHKYDKNKAKKQKPVEPELER